MQQVQAEAHSTPGSAARARSAWHAINLLALRTRLEFEHPYALTTLKFKKSYGGNLGIWYFQIAFSREVRGPW